MEEEKGKKESGGTQDPMETAAREDSRTAEGRRGPTWRGWVLSILVAIVLSVTATLLLGGAEAFRTVRGAAGAGCCGSGDGSGSCPPASAEK